MDQLREANRPKCIEHYNAAKAMYDYLARDVLLWVIICIYKRKNGQPDWEFFRKMIKEDSTLQSYEKKDLMKFENQQDINLENSDVLQLKKIIRFILSTDYKEISYKKEIEDILKDIADIRNGFAHSDEKFLDINDEAEFDTMKDDFIFSSEKLIYYSRKISTKTKEEANIFFIKFKNDLNKSWPAKLKTILPDNNNEYVVKSYKGNNSNSVEDEVSDSDVTDGIHNVMEPSTTNGIECERNKITITETSENSVNKSELREKMKEGRDELQYLMSNV